MKTAQLSLKDLLSPTDIAEAMRYGTAFDGCITFNLDDDIKKILLDNSSSKLIPLRYKITYGVITQNAQLSSTGSAWILNIFFAKDRARKFLQELSSSEEMRAILTIGTELNTLSLEIRNPSAKKTSPIIETKEQITECQHQQKYRNLSGIREIAFSDTDVAFEIYSTTTSKNRFNNKMFVMRILLTENDYLFFSSDGYLQHVFKQITLRFGNIRGTGNLVKQDTEYYLICLFPQHSDLETFKREMETKLKTDVKITRTGRSGTYDFSYTSSVSYRRIVPQNKFETTNNSDETPEPSIATEKTDKSKKQTIHFQNTIRKPRIQYFSNADYKDIYPPVFNPRMSRPRNYDGSEFSLDRYNE